MTARRRIAVRCGRDERRLWTGARALLNEALQGAATFDMTFESELGAIQGGEADLYCLSMSPDLWRGDLNWPDLEAQWRETMLKLRDEAIERGAPVFIATIFRYLPRDRRDLIHLLRRLNLMAARLSQEFGVMVIDLDRVLAHRGAIELGADALLRSGASQQAAAETIVDVLLDAGVGPLVDDECLQRAIAFHAARRMPRAGFFSSPAQLERLRQNAGEAGTLIELGQSAGMFDDGRDKIASRPPGWRDRVKTRVSKVARSFARRFERGKKPGNSK